MIKIRCYRFFNFFYTYGLSILFFVWTIELSDYRIVGLSDCRTIGLSDYSYGPFIHVQYKSKVKLGIEKIPEVIVNMKIAGQHET